jgi:hypothetical protein
MSTNPINGGITLGRPFRTLYAFDPVRNAILLRCGDKKNNFERKERLMAKKFSDLRAQMRPEARKNADAAAQPHRGHGW